MGGTSRRRNATARPASSSSAPVLRSIAAIGIAALLLLGGQPRLVPRPAGAAGAAVGRAHYAVPAPAGRARTPVRVPVGSGAGAKPGHEVAAFHRIFLPDLLIVAPKGLTSRQMARLGAIAGVRNMITFDGAEIKAGGQPASVIGVSPAQLRSWVPLRTASDQAFWTALGAGDFVASTAAARRLGLRTADSYLLTGGTSRMLRYAAAAQLGVAGIDLVVNSATSRALGLVHRVAGLINAPGVGLSTLISEVRSVLGPAGKIVSLRTEQLPLARVRPGQQPATYLELFKASAAQYCPGLSWTVLAAIGQIESADGTNPGPSSAGALGPMQFLPSTWARWGIDGFGQTGEPDIMNPYDAVPAAARLLCADGAATGGQSLRRAIFDYNHANWYVNEVLALAARYAASYS